MDPSGFLYPVEPDPVYGTNGGPIVGYTIPGHVMTAAQVAALIQKEID